MGGISKSHTIPVTFEKNLLQILLTLCSTNFSSFFSSSFFFLCFVISKEMGLQLAIFFPFVATGVHKVIFGQKLVSLLGPSTSICIGNRGRPFRFNLMQEWGKNSPGLCQFVCKIINYFKKLIFLIQLTKMFRVLLTFILIN